MPTFLIRYDLRGADETSGDYADLIAAIKEYPTHSKLMLSTWLVVTQWTALQIHDGLSRGRASPVLGAARMGYMVFRKLAQDVAGFWRFLQHELGAKFAGRWPSGAPITLAPEHDDPELGADKTRNNAFAFMESAADGFACPFGSHIRRVNPRDSLSHDSPADSIKTSARHRIVRRGIPYESRRSDDTVLDVDDDGAPRGLHFIAVATDLKRQFEFMQAQWLNDPRFDGLFADRDPVVGSADRARVGSGAAWWARRAQMQREDHENA